MSKFRLFLSCRCMYISHKLYYNCITFSTSLFTQLLIHVCNMITHHCKVILCWYSAPSVWWKPCTIDEVASYLGPGYEATTYCAVLELSLLRACQQRSSRGFLNCCRKSANASHFPVAEKQWVGFPTNPVEQGICNQQIEQQIQNAKQQRVGFPTKPVEQQI